MAITRNRCMVWKINQIYSDMVAFVVSLVYIRVYKRLLKANGFSNKSCIGEDDYINKWKCLGKVAPIYYRFYSHYVGNNPNIVPEDILHNVIEPVLTPSDYRPYYSDKNLFDKLCEEGMMPVTILRCMKGFYYNREYKKNDCQTALENIPYDRIVVKPTVETSGGQGVVVFEKKGNQYCAVNKEEVSLTKEWLEKEYRGNFIIQNCMEQSEQLALFNPSSVNTIRMGIYRSVLTDNCIVLDTLLRVGKSGQYVDNAHSGGVAIGIDVKSGKLKHQAIDIEGRMLSDINGIDLSKDYFIPNWSAVIKFAKYVSDSLPYLRLLTLDVMLNEDNAPCLIEFNCTSYSEDIFQPNATLFGEYTDEIIDYVYRHKNERCRVFVK